MGFKASNFLLGWCWNAPCKSENILPYLMSKTNHSITIVTQPINWTGVEDTAASFTVVATGQNLTYQWQYSADGGETWSDSSYSSANSATLRFTAKVAFNSYLYRCVVTDNGGASVTSGAAMLTVYSALIITAQPVDYEGQLGDTATFTVVASGDGLTYQWQFKRGSTWTSSTQEGAKTATLHVEMTEARLIYQYRCIVKDIYHNTVTSDAVKMVKVSPPTITGQPADVTVAVGETVYFTVAAEGKGLSYQWQYSADGGETWNNSGAAGYRSTTLHFAAKATYDGYLYRCVVTDSYSATATSNAAILTVTE